MIYYSQNKPGDYQRSYLVALSNREDPQGMCQTVVHSLAKPFQALALVKDYPAFKLEHLALLCASHNGTEQHAKLVQEILDEAGCSVSNLQCTPKNPFFSQIPDARYADCSGKHAGFLLLTRRCGFDIREYLKKDGPLQQKVWNTVFDSGLFPEKIFTMDGCGAPIIATSLSSLANVYQKLGDPIHPEFSQIYNAMTSYPLLVAGEGRLVTQLMQSGLVAQGDLLAKDGAGGLLGISLRHAGDILGIAIKNITDQKFVQQDLAQVALQVFEDLRLPTKRVRNALGSFL